MPDIRTLVALALQCVALALLGVGFWHQHQVDALREEFRQSGGTIDIPEALHFDGMAVSVRLPVLMMWLLLQATAPLALGFDRQRMTALAGLLFGALWLGSLLALYALLRT